MSNATLDTRTQDIVVDEIFPHSAAMIWKALTSGSLMARWLMAPSGFEPVEGCRFTFQTTPAGAWDGTIRCEVVEVRPNECFAYRWTGGHDSNVGYGSALDTLVTWTLSPAPGGTRLRLVHSGFELPRNETAFRTMGDGWNKVVPRLRAAVGEHDFPTAAEAGSHEGRGA
jgi:uncharacterized protein YndB with AHSA1/START domain